jgi:hypothetical protein
MDKRLQRRAVVDPAVADMLSDMERKRRITSLPKAKQEKARKDAARHKAGLDLPPELHEALRRIAEKEHISVSGLVTFYLYRGVVDKKKLIHEIEAANLILLRKVNWEFGEQERLRRNLPKPSASANNVFVVGDIGEDIYYDMFRRASGDGSYAFLRLVLNNEQYLNGLRVTVRGTLAELAFPFLQNGSKIAVDGHIQTRDRETGKKVVEVTAEHIAFLENINWSAGEAAQKSRAEQIKAEV